MIQIRCYILLRNMFSLKINKKLPLDVVEGFGSLVPCVKTENDVKLCLSTLVTLCPNMAERCRHKKKMSSPIYLVCL